MTINISNSDFAEEINANLSEISLILGKEKQEIILHTLREEYLKIKQLMKEGAE